MPVSRRSFLSTAVAGAVMPLGLRAQPARRRSGARFTHGVASGDPLKDRVMLWTRVSRSAADAVEVFWTLASDPAFRKIVGRGSVWTGSDRDHTVKVDAGGLRAGGTYYYRFECAGERSPVGRTKTLPAGDVARLRMAIVSCSNYPFGYFNVYGRVAARADLDLVLHLGDYIYEYKNAEYGDGTALGRIPAPDREIVTLSDYRTRYAQYRMDPDLQEVHRQHPFVTVWDDHEITNNTWQRGAQNHNPEKGEGDFPPRKAASVQAYLEWLPCREQSSRLPRIYRSFPVGSLADLVMLDTRLYGRDQQVAADDLAAIASPERHMLGPAQEAWLFDELRESQRSGVRWRIVGQQLIFARLSPPNQKAQNPDAWDGYQGSRERVFDFVEREKVQNLVVLSGDVHSSWAMDLPRAPWDGYDPASGRGSLGVEIVTPAVSSPATYSRTPEVAPERIAALMKASPHLRYMEGLHRGYVVLDVTAERAQADWFFVPTVTERTASEHHGRSFVTESGSSHLTDVSSPVAPAGGLDPAPS